MTAAISRISDINLRLPRQHLKTPVFKCFLAMTGNSKICRGPSGSDPLSPITNRNFDKENFSLTRFIIYFRLICEVINLSFILLSSASMNALLKITANL